MKNEKYFMIIPKKIIAAVFPFLLVTSLSVSGCGNGDSTASTSRSSEQIIQTEESTMNSSSGSYIATVSESENTDETNTIDPELEQTVLNKISSQIMPVNPYTRPGDKLENVTAIAVHYLANPGTTAQENADYFTSLSYSGEESMSCHFIIGLDGQIIQLVPTDEIAYCTNEANSYSISIECCHPDETGVYTDETYESLVQLTSYLLEKYGLTYENIIRHYDVTGKICPLAFVADPDYWYGFKADVANLMGTAITADEIAAVSNDSFATEEEIEETVQENIEMEYGTSDSEDDFPGEHDRPGDHGGPLPPD